MSTSTSPCKILVVEDESVVAMDIETSLESLGYTVAGIAESGEEAVHYAELRRPDLILMDIQLRGEMDGITAAQNISQRFDLPVVFVTANTNDEIIVRAKQSGSYGFLNKPFRPKELNATIEIALHQHRASQKLFAERGWLWTMLSSISDGVIATDADGFVRFLNPAACRFTGWSHAEGLGKPIEQVYPLAHLNGEPVERCQLRKALHEKQAIPKERFLVALRNGGQRAVEDAAAPIIESGQVLGAVTIFVDISSTLLAEQASMHERDRLSQQVQLTSDALGETREELQALTRHLMSAQDSEARRISRELHDDLGQQTALLAMQADQLERELPDESRAKASALRLGLGTLAQGLRDVSHHLHPSTIADLGLSEALSALVTEFRQKGLAIQMSLGHLENMPVDVSTSLYRIAQEGLRNVLKHAPQATVQVVLSATEKTVHLDIADDGPGFVLGDMKRQGGLGLISMQERARLIGGEMLLSAELNKGTTLQVNVPLPSRT